VLIYLFQNSLYVGVEQNNFTRWRYFILVKDNAVLSSKQVKIEIKFDK